ncbi:MAG: hypothetical protein KF861_09045 [Planctomycetaceae bacterium]|nr:hypothetical protein [Planctomycetaceae bacterium]
MAGKLKGFDIKKLALKHGEKLVLSIVGLLVLYVVTMGTKWVPFQHHPREITNAVDEAKHKLSQKTWPVEDQQNFVVPEEKKVENLVAILRKPVDSSPYEFSQAFRFDLYGTTTPITEPKLFPVGKLIADAGRAAILVNPTQKYTDYFAEDSDADWDAEVETSTSADDDIPPEFRSPTSGSRVPGLPRGQGTFEDDRAIGGFGADTSDPRSRRGAGANPAGVGPTARGGGARGAGPALGPQRGGRTGRNQPNPNAMNALMQGAAGGLSGLGSALGIRDRDDAEELVGPLGGRGGYGGGAGGKARGIRFVALRGAVPLKEQIREYRKAANVSFFEAEQLFQIIDFELQRQKMLRGVEDPWSGEWETVDIEPAKEILRESAFFDAEPLEVQVTDSTITMPLPGRALGIWDYLAMHPDLKKFALSDEEMELEMQFQEKLLEQHKKFQQDLPEELVVKKGFSDVVGDGRSLMTSMRGGAGGVLGNRAQGARRDLDDDEDPSGFGMVGGRGGMRGGAGFAVGNTYRPGLDPNKFFEELEKAEGDKAQRDVLKKWVERHLKEMGATGEMLLFRYFDFDVEPGATYRYRVRLEVTNPNYGRKSSEAAGIAEVVEGQTRKTEWSNIAGEVRVPHDMDYFVDYIRQRGTDRLFANWMLFQWDPEFGTTVAKRDIEVELGQEVGGPSKPYVLDPAIPRFEIENYQFQSGDVFVDAKHVDAIDPAEHPELSLAPSAKRRDLQISDQVLVMRGNGVLDVIDQLSRTAELKERLKRLGYEQKEFADVKGVEAQQRTPANAAGVTMGDPDMQDLMSLYGVADDDGGGMRSGGNNRGRARNSLRKGPASMNTNSR